MTTNQRLLRFSALIIQQVFWQAKVGRSTGWGPLRSMGTVSTPDGFSLCLLLSRARPRAHTATGESEVGSRENLARVFEPLSRVVGLGS